MHDPLTVAFEIRRPWPRRNHGLSALRRVANGPRWHVTWGPYWTLAGRAYYWPPMVTVWHHDPSGYDSTTCWHRKRGWRLHVHHWSIQVHPLQQLRRRLLTRCSVCGGRSTRKHPVNFARSWDRESGPWWRGETGLDHGDCFPRPSLNAKEA